MADAAIVHFGKVNLNDKSNPFQPSESNSVQIQGVTAHVSILFIFFSPPTLRLLWANSQSTLPYV